LLLDTFHCAKAHRIKIRNPNIEIRNKREELNGNHEIQKRAHLGHFEFLMIELFSNFGSFDLAQDRFRVSNL